MPHRLPPAMYWALCTVAVLLCACGGPQMATPAPATVRIAGSTSLEPVLAELAQAYEAAHPHVLLDVRGGDTAIGLEQLRSGQIDLAAISWKPEGALPPADIVTVPVARDGVAIVVHPRNTLSGLTLVQLRALYRGETLDWSAVGGAGGEPVIVSREDGSGTRAAFEALVMGDARVTLNALVMPTNQAVVDYVASHRNAIGYVSTAVLTDTVRAVPMEDVVPTATTLRSGAYPLGRVLYLCAPQPTPPATQAFLDFVLSPAGQAIVARRLAPMR
jgi:phosphate transport system substrate-binding protein